MADTKISDLTEEATPIGTDLVAIVDDPGGTPTTKKATISAVLGVSHSHTVSQISDAGALAAADTVDTAEIDDEAVTNSKLAHMAQSTIKGRAASAGTGDATDLTATQVRAILNVEDGATADQTAAEISIADSGDIITATTVEGALQENRAAIDAIEADYLTSSAIGVSVQAYDAQLDTWSGVTPSANGQSLVAAANYAAMRGLLDLEVGTDFYSISAADSAISSAISTALADYTTTADFASTSNGDGAALIGIEDSGTLFTATDVEAALAEVMTDVDAIEADYLTSSAIGSSVQAYDAQLDTWATVTPSANGQSLVAAANYAAMRGLLDLEPGTDFYSISAADAAFASASHNHAASAITSGTLALARGGLGTDASGVTGLLAVSGSALQEIDTIAELNAQISDATLAVAGKQTLWIPASAMIPATTNGAATATVETSTNAITVDVLDFDAGTDEFAHFSVTFPNSWNLSTITFQVFWMSTATDTDGVAWALQGTAISDNQALDSSWGTAVVVTDDAQSAAEEVYATSESSALTIAGTPADGDLVAFRILRDVSDANDDMAEDARLLGVKLFYTTNAGDDA